MNSIEKKNLIKPLFKKHQPNWSALSCYFEGKMPGTAYVNPVEYEFIYLEPHN